MPKMKTNRGVAKRFLSNGSGALRHRRTNRSHILTKKSPGRKRRLRAAGALHKADRHVVARMMPYGGRG